jgi:hypothetical protein
MCCIAALEMALMPVEQAKALCKVIDALWYLPVMSYLYVLVPAGPRLPRLVIVTLFLGFRTAKSRRRSVELVETNTAIWLFPQSLREITVDSNYTSPPESNCYRSHSANSLQGTARLGM